VLKGSAFRVTFEKALRNILRMAAGNPGPRTIHKTRKEITKLRSWLRLLRDDDFPGYHEHSKRLRKCARILAPARDAHVLCETFEAICNGSGFIKLRKHLKERRRKEQRALETKIHELKQLLEEELKSVDDFTGVTTMRLLDGLERIREEMNDAKRSAHVRKSNSALHTWRKRIKNFSHAAALLDKTPRAALGEELVQLRGMLGELHDLLMLYHMLADEIEKHPDLDHAMGHRAAVLLRNVLVPRHLRIDARR